jgi:release factor H-coupled RctB family protein
VIADLVDHDLATPVATTVPLITYKTRDLGSPPQPDRRDHRRKRGRP